MPTDTMSPDDEKDVIIISSDDDDEEEVVDDDEPPSSQEKTLLLPFGNCERIEFIDLSSDDDDDEDDVPDGDCCTANFDGNEAPDESTEATTTKAPISSVIVVDESRPEPPPPLSVTMPAQPNHQVNQLSLTNTDGLSYSYFEGPQLPPPVDYLRQCLPNAHRLIPPDAGDCLVYNPTEFTSTFGHYSQFGDLFEDISALPFQVVYTPRPIPPSTPSPPPPPLFTTVATSPLPNLTTKIVIGSPLRPEPMVAADALSYFPSLDSDDFLMSHEQYFLSPPSSHVLLPSTSSNIHTVRPNKRSLRRPDETDDDYAKRLVRLEYGRRYWARKVMSLSPSERSNYWKKKSNSPKTAQKPKQASKKSKKTSRRK